MIKRAKLGQNENKRNVYIKSYLGSSTMLQNMGEHKVAIACLLFIKDMYVAAFFAK